MVKNGRVLNLATLLEQLEVKPLLGQMYICVYLYLKTLIEWYTLTRIYGRER